MLSNTPNNLVITTNFDTLAEDALHICSEKKPLVIDHEALAKHLDMSYKGPVILQINRGLFWEPRNSRRATRKLDGKWKTALDVVFALYTPVVVGYSGGDKSLMGYLKKASLKGLFWCYLSDSAPDGDVQELVESKNGRVVEIDGFDEMMFHLGVEFGNESPVERILSLADSRARMYDEANNRMSEKYGATKSLTASQKQTARALESADEKIVRDLSAEIEKTPGIASLYFYRANAYYRLKKHEDVIADYTKAIELDPEDTASYYNRGVSYNALKRHDAAIADYTKAIELDPEDTASYYNRGVSYNALKRHDAAIADYTKAIELDPEYALAYGNRGNSYSDLKQYDAAIADYTKAIELDPKYADAYNNRGYVFTKLKLYDKAMDDIATALSLDSEDAVYYVSQGRIGFETEQYDDALASLNKAVSLDPSIPNTYYWLGRVYDALGQDDKAQEYFAKAKELGYEEEDAT